MWESSCLAGPSQAWLIVYLGRTPAGTDQEVGGNGPTCLGYEKRSAEK
jgi:hypothetical protein